LEQDPPSLESTVNQDLPHLMSSGLVPSSQSDELLRHLWSCGDTVSLVCLHITCGNYWDLPITGSDELVFEQC